jgi:hypothetical protein
MDSLAAPNVQKRSQSIEPIIQKPGERQVEPLMRLSDGTPGD